MGPLGLEDEHIRNICTHFRIQCQLLWVRIQNLRTPSEEMEYLSTNAGEKSIVKKNYFETTFNHTEENHIDEPCPVIS